MDNAQDPDASPGPGTAFRRDVARAVAWVERFLDHPEEFPVLPDVEPGQIRAQLAARPPDAPEPMERILEDFESLIAPANTQWNHPGFFGYFAISSVGPAIVAEMLAATLNPNAMVWLSSPAATELELHVVDWLRDLLGLPSSWFGSLTDSASTSTFHALAAARQRAYPEVGRSGLTGMAPGSVYVSEQTHSSVEKAVRALGLGAAGTRTIPVDAQFRMDVGALEAAIDQDRREGRVPVAVVATAGTTSTSAVDPIERIADVASRRGAWLHVDAAYGGSAALLPEARPLFNGWERADSVVVNPHKWLFVPIDCSVLWVADPEPLRDAFTLVPEYLRTPADGSAPNLMDYGLALGRRFRALKLWVTLRALGVDGIRARLRKHIEWARVFASWVDEDPEWERLAPVPLGLVVFRYAGGADEAALGRINRAILDRVNESGEVFLSHTALSGRMALRLSVGNARTERRHVERAWALLKEAAGAVAVD